MRKPPRPKKDKITGLKPKQLEYLIYGSQLVTWPDLAFNSEQEAKEAWAENRDYMLSNIDTLLGHVPMRDLIVRHGSRPWAWWRWDSTGTRKLISGSSSNVVEGSDFHFGVPNRYISHKASRENEYESQHSYLKRTGNLLPGEEQKYSENKES